ncbi:hypothetical protein DPMN_194646 [Dreissena polymorpha]|uniref:Uncharacterized protein n=1 Tax=Dreissena polymorpha TaxID=45954 RepID=A0A9D3XZT6_DREPO|nr:hypothetical protein DPMN_194646 [Dreissena polymorpha]
MGAMFLLWKDRSPKKRLHTMSGTVEEKREKAQTFKRQGAGREDHTSEPKTVKTDGLPERSV